MAVGGWLACAARAGDKERGRAIEFSGPGNDEVATNLYQLTNKKDGLKQLEEELYQPLQSFAPKSSLEGVAAPLPRVPVRSVIQSKRARELLERQREWMFMRPEDLIGEPTAEGFLQAPKYGPDGTEQRDLSPMERYYLSLAAKRKTTLNAGQTNDDDLLGTLDRLNQKNQASSFDDSELPGGLKASVEKLRSFLPPTAGGNDFDLSTTASSLADIFGLGRKASSPAQMLQRKKLADEYHSLLDPSWQPSTTGNLAGQPSLADLLNPLSSLGGASRPVAAPSTGLGTLPKPATPNPIEAQWNIVNPMLGPAPLPDVNAQAVGQTRPPPGLPKVETPKVVAPTFTAPKRVF
jgi:hypothetical protein